MANKTENEEQKTKLILQADINDEISYQMVKGNFSPFNRLYVKNTTEEDLENVTINIHSQPAFLIEDSYSSDIIPRTSTVNYDCTSMVSPLFLAEIDHKIEGKIYIDLLINGKLEQTLTKQVSILGINECNYSDKKENLAWFVRQTPQTKQINNRVDDKLDQWKLHKASFYHHATKNDVRNYFAALYSVLSEYNFSIYKDSNQFIQLKSTQEIFNSKTLSDVDLTLLFASVLESVGINCVFGKISSSWYVGCYLTDECYNNILFDDANLLYNKLLKSVGEMSLISITKFMDGIIFQSNEKASLQSVKHSKLDFLLDLKFARLMGIDKLPVRVKTDKGYEFIQSQDYESTDYAPDKLIEYDDLKGDKNISREKQWERRLLDLDMRNSLLNFKPSKISLKLMSSTMENFISNVDNERYELSPYNNENVLKITDDPYSTFSDNNLASDYLRYEMQSHKLKCEKIGKDFEQTLLKIYRKEKSRQEESGTNSLYISVGLIKWTFPNETEYRYAPIMLYPVTLTKTNGSSKYYVTISEDEVHINTTLLEFLYQQFNIDIRLLSDIKPKSLGDFVSVVARLKKEVASIKNFSILDTIYLSSFSFSSYLMWKDVREHIDIFKENKVISSLLNNSSAFTPSEMTTYNYSSDDAYNSKDDTIYLPISADSSQYSAIVDSLTKSFVLHGPPGTGKSQTITNIIVNNIVRGKRVLFVAEKMAALDVVNRRLNNIGIGDFCLELYSDKTKKTDIAQKILHTLSLAKKNENSAFTTKKEELSSIIKSLNKEITAMSKPHNIGLSIYQGIVGYLENKDAPDCITIDPLFYEKLSETKLYTYLNLLTELSARAIECGSIAHSPFAGIGYFEYNEDWRTKAEQCLIIYTRELKNLKSYTKNIMAVLGLRTINFSFDKIQAIYAIANLIKNQEIINFYTKATSPMAIGYALSYLNKLELQSRKINNFTKKYSAFPQQVFNSKELINAQDDEKARIKLSKKYSSSVKTPITKQTRVAYFNDLLEIAQINDDISLLLNKLSGLFLIPLNKTVEITERAKDLLTIIEKGKIIYNEYEENTFFNSMVRLIKSPLYIDFFIKAYDNTKYVSTLFAKTFALSIEQATFQDANQFLEYLNGIYKNLDLMVKWNKLQEIINKCRDNGFGFIIEPLLNGTISPNEILSCFKKCLYYNFVTTEIALDETLSAFSGLTFEELIERFKFASDEFERLTRIQVYEKLCARIPLATDEGPQNEQKVILSRAIKNNLKGVTLRNLLPSIQELLKFACPCMLMSPSSVTQFLDINMEKFDLVIFDEASQVQTCKAIGTIARAKNVIIVGDPKQLPPTTFFGADFKDDEHMEVEDLDSILDDCLAVGIPERSLSWHYRSHHESLIAFSNIMYYDNKLLTFPSPSDINSKVSLHYVDGYYDRGGNKYNKKEGEELVQEVITRLKDPIRRNQSIGIVTFSSSQQNYIEDILYNEIKKENLEEIAYYSDEPVFVKNLENVQGDERDVILFSVGYGPDAEGKIYMNFGPLNQAGGYRRLNVAVTRARMEMVVFSSLKGNMIDLSRTNSVGVKGLKAFLEYAEKGRDMLVFNAKNIKQAQQGVGKFVAKELMQKGVLCDYNIGVSDFKIDVAVIDPRDKQRYLLGIICDSENSFKIPSARDRIAMQTKILKTLGWNIYHLWGVNYIANPRREIGKIKERINELLDEKEISKKTIKDALVKYKKAYRISNLRPLKGGIDYITNYLNYDSIHAKITQIVTIEQPIDEVSLIERLLSIYNLQKTSKKAINQLTMLIDTTPLNIHTFYSTKFYSINDINYFRPMDENHNVITKVSPYEFIAAAQCALETKNKLSPDELIREILNLMNIPRKTKTNTERIMSALDIALKDNRIILTVDGYYTI